MSDSVGLRLALLLAIVVLGGCKRHSGAGGREVVLYTSVDEPYVRPLIETFEKQTGIKVTLLTDAEASKSVGLAERLRAEKDHPQADVWWDNECFLSAELAEEGVLAPYDSPSAVDVPEQFRDANHRWAGSVLRVRVFVCSPTAPGASEATHLQDLLKPQWKAHIALARPTAGTTGGHVAALYVLWGRERAETFFRKLHDNGVVLVGGNSVVADAVARGDIYAGLCDNDDAASASTEVGKLNMSLPDQGPDDAGTLAMPCAVGLVAGAPHPQAARQLIDFLLSKQVDRALVDAKFAWCSVRDTSQAGKLMKVDYQAVAREMPAGIRSATAILEGR